MTEIIDYILALPQQAQIALAIFVVIILFSIFKKLIKLALTLLVILAVAIAIFKFTGL